VRIAALLLTVVLAGCTQQADAPTAEPAPDVAFSVSQHRVDENTPVANLRVVNLDEDRPVDVTEVGVDWPGYGGEHVEPNEATVMPGQTLDLRMTLPEPTCTDEVLQQPAYGVIAVAGGEQVRGRLEPAGQSFLESLWRRSCNTAAVSAVADLRFGDRWRTVGRGTSASYVGSFVVDRTGSPDSELAVEGIEGSILFDLAPRGLPAVLGPGQDRLVLPVRLSPFRCDAHARGETTQAFLFRLDVAVDGAEPVRVTLTTDDEDWKIRAMDYLDGACG